MKSKNNSDLEQLWRQQDVKYQMEHDSVLEAVAKFLRDTNMEFEQDENECIVGKLNVAPQQTLVKGQLILNSPTSTNKIISAVAFFDKQELVFFVDNSNEYIKVSKSCLQCIQALLLLPEYVEKPKKRKGRDDTIIVLLPWFDEKTAVTQIYQARVGSNCVGPPPKKRSGAPPKIEVIWIEDEIAGLPCVSKVTRKWLEEQMLNQETYKKTFKALQKLKCRLKIA